MKSFLVTQSQTPNAVKFMVCKKLGLDVKEFNMFGLYVVDGDSSSTSGKGHPFLALVPHGSSGRSSGICALFRIYLHFFLSPCSFFEIFALEEPIH